MIDPNEVFPFLRTTTNEELIDKVIEKSKERIQKMQTARLGPSAAIESRQFVRVQPTDETRPGAAAAQPMTGPSPAASGRQDVFGLAEANKMREEAQEESRRGPGPAPVSVHVGETSEGAIEEGKRLIEEERREQQEQAKKAAGQQEEGGGQQQGAAPAMPAGGQQGGGGRPAPARGGPGAVPGRQGGGARGAQAPGPRVPGAGVGAQGAGAKDVGKS